MKELLLHCIDKLYNMEDLPPDADTLLNVIQRILEKVELNLDES